MAGANEFQVVKRKHGKRNGRKVTDASIPVQIDDVDSFNIISFKKRLKDYMEELKLTELLQDCIDNIFDALSLVSPSPSVMKEKSLSTDFEQVKTHLHSDTLKHKSTEAETTHTPCFNQDSWPHLLSYGIGRFISCPIARYQLAFLLVLREKFQTQTCLVYDPLFSAKEKAVLEDFGCSVIPYNEEGKRVCDVPTVLFMPHCGKALYNNVVWANLDKLNILLIIGNSFSRMIESVPHRILMQTANYVIKVSPYIVEKPLKSASFVHSDVFNDLSLHFCPSDQLKTAPVEFWEGNSEPEYSKEEVEFIRKQDCGTEEL